MSQALNAAYQLSQRVELAPSAHGSIRMPMTVGLRGDFECERCTDAMRAERGFCPFVEQPAPATQPTCLSDSGTPADEISACPRGVLLRNPGLAPTLQSFWGIQAATVPGWYGQDGLLDLPPRVAATFQELHAVEQRFIASINRMRSLMDRRPQ